MASRKKNKALPLIILVAALVVLMVGYLILKDYNAKKAAEDAEVETSTIEVMKKEKAILTAFSYTVEGKTLAFSYDNEQWVYPEDKTYHIDGEAVAKMVAGLTDIKAVSVVETEGADIDGFGLGKPQQTIWAKYSDGSEYTFTFGIVNSYNSYQYMKFSGSEDIYMVESTVASPFSKTLKELYEDEIWILQNDAVTYEDVTSIVVETADGKSNKIEDEAGIEKLFNLVYKLNLATWEDHYADETEMKDTYGISSEGDRVTVNYTKDTSVTNDNGTASTVSVPASYTVYFGNEFEVVDDAETGTEASKKDLRFFYTQKGSDVVYSADEDVSNNIFVYLTYVPPVETEAETEA